MLGEMLGEKLDRLTGALCTLIRCNNCFKHNTDIYSLQDKAAQDSIKQIDTGHEYLRSLGRNICISISICSSYDP